MPETTPVQEQPPIQSAKPGPFAGARKDWKFVLAFVVFSFIVLNLEIAYQVNSGADFDTAIIRGDAFAGMTFLSLALLCSILFKMKPPLAKYWHIRRSLGVAGGICIALHIFNVIRVVFQYNALLMFSILDPIQNPIILGALAFPIIFLMTITSWDFAVEKLGFKRWKNIHKLVYIAYPLAVFHYLIINPVVLWTPPGYLLLAITAAVVVGQLYYFVRTVLRKGIRSRASILGILVILFWILLAFVVYG